MHCALKIFIACALRILVACTACWDFWLWLIGCWEFSCTRILVVYIVYWELLLQGLNVENFCCMHCILRTGKFYCTRHVLRTFTCTPCLLGIFYAVRFFVLLLWKRGLGLPPLGVWLLVSLLLDAWPWSFALGSMNRISPLGSKTLVSL